MNRSIKEDYYEMYLTNPLKLLIIKKFIGQKLSWERFVHTDVAASPNLMDYPYGMMRKMVCRLFRLQM